MLSIADAPAKSVESPAAETHLHVNALPSVQRAHLLMRGKRKRGGSQVYIP